jgi:hypothetical protein
VECEAIHQWGAWGHAKKNDEGKMMRFRRCQACGKLEGEHVSRRLLTASAQASIQPKNASTASLSAQLAVYEALFREHINLMMKPVFVVNTEGS